MNAFSKALVPVILSGGMGTRLWPMSRGSYPKQFLALNTDEHCLIQETVLKLRNDERFEAPVIVCNADHRFLVAEKMREIGVKNPDIILEPVGRNTAPAIAVAAHYVRDKYGDDACMLVLPSDHIIADTDAFLEGAMKAWNAAHSGNLVTFGITPEYAETGYGYIKLGSAIDEESSAYKVQKFVEKPDEQTAKQYIDSGEYVWNSGMFCFQTGALLEELKTYQSEMTQIINQVVNLRNDSGDFISLDEELFSSIQGNSIDYAVMEHTNKAVVVPLSCGWNDVGSWDALWRIKEKNAEHNVIDGETYTIDTEDCYISCEDGVRVATLGVKDLVVISTKDIVMIADKNRTQEVKDMVAKVKAESPALVDQHRQVYRPWGHFDSVDSGSRHQVKRITVNPGDKISDQMHYHRSEHWIVVSGTALVTKGEEVMTITENQSVYIPSGVRHRLENPGKIPLEVIEVQSGSYLGEDDIVRFSDDYGRIEKVERVA